MVITFVPISSGMAGVFQFVVPRHAPEPAVELLHVTVVTPILSEAVPVTTILVAEV
jgi:hypothetical protein